ncbi:hypothetical protein VOLCADRAFT_103039 [Volvox carteri f. nagariensis]|uniref:Dienelactone hydrolase domain-containing protein n=1 Tax=Volvox carteri f. nagariensis TaxID=3068 RepID=D8TJI7_VOLCA|nr:uncharacterized protein VOLCADRAFT_103039 [Volvox carteri f. nagariensis]EFJ52550.1 hypothetical protein VOLCADRAFT_103039 [Volvox carteri f. nagariensis]|eukprot:XP_002946623.1 hypothetical protein VOLCADRAFT_103039 [Volvox carteri f. nagariensis]
MTFGNGLPGYEVGEKTAPGLLVIQNDLIKEVAIMLSKAGFRCLIPDLYKGKIGLDAEEAAHLLNELDFQNAVEELKQAVQYLKSTGSAKVGAVGFCMGGALSFCAAQHCGVTAAAPFYGTPNATICEVEKITVPVEAHFGALDTITGFSDAATAKALEEKMKQAGAPATFYYYERSGHSFFNAVTSKATEYFAKYGYPVPAPEEVSLARQRLVDFFSKYLS